MSKLHMSVSPHFRTAKTTTSIMLDVIIAMLPTAVAGVIIFGLRALAVIAACLIASVLSEYLFCLITKREQTVTDLSAAVTGLILALNLPANIPIWQAVIGSVFAVICVKCLFGGIGQNFANPAATARVFMTIAFGSMAVSAFPVDSTASATPIPNIMNGDVPNLLDLFLGKNGGTIGEVCFVAIILGGVYLVLRGVIRPHAPLAFMLTVFLLSLAFEGGNFTTALAWLMSGGLAFGAVFMATDYSTTPLTDLGKIIFGIGAALITVLIRFFGSYPEGVSFSILFMNILTPYIDKLTKKRPFGGDCK